MQFVKKRANGLKLEKQREGGRNAAFLWTSYLFTMHSWSSATVAFNLPLDKWIVLFDAVKNIYSLCVYVCRGQSSEDSYAEVGFCCSAM